MDSVADLSRRRFSFRVVIQTLFVEQEHAGSEAQHMMAMPVAMPKLVTPGAEQSCRRRAATCAGTAIRSSSTLPFSSHEVAREMSALELRK
jgi:hypothetical protein